MVLSEALFPLFVLEYGSVYPTDTLPFLEQSSSLPPVCV